MEDGCSLSERLLGCLGQLKLPRATDERRTMIEPLF
jgi:hypothetical protein